MTPDLDGFVRRQTGRPDARIADRAEELFDPNLGSAATGGLRRVRGTTTDGDSWSFFVKTIHSVRHWP